MADRQVGEFSLAHAPERGMSERVAPPAFGLGEVAACGQTVHYIPEKLDHDALP